MRGNNLSLEKRETYMSRLNHELAARALSDLDVVVGGGKIGDTAQTVKPGLTKTAADIGEGAILPLFIPFQGGR
jgi:hypothetical protein